MTWKVKSHESAYGVGAINEAIWYTGHVLQSIRAAGQKIALETERIGKETRWCIFWVVCALVCFVGETMIVFTALSSLQFQIFNQPVSGAVFFSVVPLAFAGYHLQVHENYNAPLKKLFDRLGQVGILFMVFGLSALLGLSFVRGGLDTMLSSGSSTGWAGTGPNGQQVGGSGSEGAWEGFLVLLDGLPIVVFGLALCFSFLIAIYVASIAIRKARDHYAYIDRVHNRDGHLDELQATETVGEDLIALRPEALRLAKRMPVDPVQAFSKAYFGYVSGELTTFDTLAMLAHRSGLPWTIEDGVTQDPRLVRMLEQFSSYEEASAHFTRLEDEARPFNTQLILDGNPGAHTPS